MSRLTTVLRSLGRQPSYTLMRGIARFEIARTMVARSRSLLQRDRVRCLLRDCEARITGSQFPDLDREAIVQCLRRDGIAYGLRLRSQTVAKIHAWAKQQPCYADRDSRQGFELSQRAGAEARLKKPILLAQYFNTTTQCAAISGLISDPALLWIAARYLESIPTFVGANLWWTFPVSASEVDRARHAHHFHRDVDDFRFFKFFFYLTDVHVGEGAHVCVAASHREPPRVRIGDRWNIRRYQDGEIAAIYPLGRVHEICGVAGTGFAEDTLCIHKGSTPRSEARLLLQLQYALFDYGAMHDRRAPHALATLA